MAQNRFLPPQPTILKNVSCPYCGTQLDDQNRSKEHAVARSSVPKGSLDGAWNLILNACKACNGAKSDLEDDIPAISMQPDPTGRHPREDPRLIKDAARKGAKSWSRLTGMPVGKSTVRQTFNFSLGPGMTVSVGSVGPPQVEESRVFALAWYQLAAFFYFVTYDDQSKTGKHWPGEFVPVMQSVRSDWGNVRLRAFTDAVANWLPRLCGMTAGGFLRVAIRRKTGADCWSWALEWNESIRVIGFFGDPAEMETAVAHLPEPEMHTLGRERGPAGATIRLREEVPVKEGDQDKLFAWEEPQPPRDEPPKTL
ncbi:MAG: hypothetical protein WEB59_07145 [Thermoanaerobaculia bacterium]